MKMDRKLVTAFFLGLAYISFALSIDIDIRFLKLLLAIVSGAACYEFVKRIYMAIEDSHHTQSNRRYQ